MAFFVTFPEYGQYAVAGLRGPTTIGSVVRTFLDRGVDQIKVGASERAGLFTTDPRRPELTLEEIQAAVAEARKDGKFVEAHAHAESGVAAAVGAGVRSVAHGTYANETTLQLMKTRGTFLVPTLAIMSPLGDPTGDTENAIALQVRTRHMETAVRSVVWKAKQLGIPIVAATDGSSAATGASARVRLQHDMEAMLATGFSPMEAIAAGTRDAARLAGIEGRTGTVQVGLEADLLVVDRDPISDFSTLYEPIVVISNGEVILNRIY